ncbi:MAG: serine/threonine-protein kinase [Phycisphaerae bacterium]
MRSFAQLPDYDLVRRLGRGAHATINLAVDRRSRRQVAVKHVIRRNPDDDKFIAQAETEYDVCKRLDHPALRKCYDIIRIRKWMKTAELFLIMEFADGETLEVRRPQGLREFARVFRDVADGLHALHMRGYAHADIKPNNILLTTDGVKIIDFGQSCPLGHIKQRVQGTPDYMAPEQVLRQRIDHRTDVFNLGATMYWVVTGKAYMTMMPTAQVASKKIEIEARRANDAPHEMNPRVPVALSRLIMECCETDPEKRPRDMRDLNARLEVVQHLLARRRRRAPDEDTDRAAALPE